MVYSASMTWCYVRFYLKVCPVFLYDLGCFIWYFFCEAHTPLHPSPSWSGGVVWFRWNLGVLQTSPVLTESLPSWFLAGMWLWPLQLINWELNNTRTDITWVMQVSRGMILTAFGASLLCSKLHVVRFVWPLSGPPFWVYPGRTNVLGQLAPGHILQYPVGCFLMPKWPLWSWYFTTGGFCIHNHSNPAERSKGLSGGFLPSLGPADALWAAVLLSWLPPGVPADEIPRGWGYGQLCTLWSIVVTPMLIPGFPFPGVWSSAASSSLPGLPVPGRVSGFNTTGKWVFRHCGDSPAMVGITI